MNRDSGQFRFTSILVVEGMKRKMYRSVEDMPPQSRHALMEATRGDQSATILIADEAGEKFLQEVVRSRLHEEQPAQPAEAQSFWHGTGWRWTVELAICSGAAFLLWFLATLR
jgi:hypothetical protein